MDPGDAAPLTSRLPKRHTERVPAPRGEPLVDGMAALPPPLNLDWDDLGDRTVVLLPDRLTDEPILEDVTDQVIGLVNALGRRRFVLDFVRVPYLTSGPIRLLVALRKRLNEVGGALWLAH